MSGEGLNCAKALRGRVCFHWFGGFLFEIPVFPRLICRCHTALIIQQPLGNFLDETRCPVHRRFAEQRAGSRVEDIQLFLRARQTHITEPTFLFHGGADQLHPRAIGGEHILLHASKEHIRKLQPFCAVDRHEGNAARAFLHRVDIRYEGHVFQKGGECAFSFRHRRFDFFYVAHKLAQVFHTGICLALFIIRKKVCFILNDIDHALREAGKRHERAFRQKIRHHVSKWPQFGKRLCWHTLSAHGGDEQRRAGCIRRPPQFLERLVWQVNSCRPVVARHVSGAVPLAF